jgi:hypothetical protein
VRAYSAPPAPPILARRLRHRPDCTRPDARAYVGREGDVVIRCSSCAYYVVCRDVDPSTLTDGVVRYRALGDRPPRPEPEEPEHEPAAPAYVAPTLVCIKCARPFPVRPGRAVVPVCPDCKDSGNRGRRA